MSTSNELPEITAQARRVFSRGACAGLAIALHLETHFDLIKITDCWNVHNRSDGARVAGDGSAMHWVVLAPGSALGAQEDRFLDIDGLHPPYEMIEEYAMHADNGCAEAGEYDVGSALSEYEERHGSPVPIDRCKGYARAVLQSVDWRDEDTANRYAPSPQTGG